MKKVIYAILTIVIICFLCGCSSVSTLPNGHAAWIEIDYGSGLRFDDVDFEYVNDSTIKIVDPDSDYIHYYPVNKIESIVVAK